MRATRQHYDDATLSGIAPWIHWSKRFSIRTLLIAMTLVAVMLGMVVITN